jgi:hypothetical protein
MITNVTDSNYGVAEETTHIDDIRLCSGLNRGRDLIFERRLTKNCVPGKWRISTMRDFEMQFVSAKYH